MNTIVLLLLESLIDSLGSLGIIPVQVHHFSKVDNKVMCCKPDNLKSGHGPDWFLWGQNSSKPVAGEMI